MPTAGAGYPGEPIIRHPRTFATTLATGVLATAGVLAATVTPVTIQRPGSVTPVASTPPTIPVDRHAHGPTVTSALFGTHVLHSATVWPSVPTTSERIWDDQVTWANIEPQPGVWDFSRLDQQVATARSHGASVIITLGQTPTWASSRPNEVDSYGNGAASPPTSNAFWTQYVTTVAQRYAGKVLGYEVWNEPDFLNTWHGSPNQLATLTKLAGQAIRSVDSHAKVLSPSFVIDDKYVGNWLRGWISAGGNKSVDVIAVHGYTHPYSPPEEASALMRSFRSILTNHGIRKPTWNTEATTGRHPKPLSYAVGGGRLARVYLLSTWLHMPRMYWYAWDDYDFSGVQLTTKSGSGTPVRRDYKAVYSWILHARERSCASSGAVWSCTFDRGGHTFVAAWARTGSHSAKVPRGFHHMRTLGGKITRITPGHTITLSERPVWLSA